MLGCMKRAVPNLNTAVLAGFYTALSSHGPVGLRVNNPSACSFWGWHCLLWREIMYNKPAACVRSVRGVQCREMLAFTPQLHSLQIQELPPPPPHHPLGWGGGRERGNKKNELSDQGSFEQYYKTKRKIQTVQEMTLLGFWIVGPSPAIFMGLLVGILDRLTLFYEHLIDARLKNWIARNISEAKFINVQFRWGFWA